ncbi:MAG: WD40 repeat domain-containing protein, partial [Anaerolineae bacterium]|nr:WD40 repeat domain-containing protein [Anaerolineae bacterium]
GSAKVWDVASGAEVASLDGHTDGVNSAAFSPDGALIVTASDDGSAKVWDVASGAEVASLDGHTDGVNTAAFSPDGALIVTASDDGSAKVWSIYATLEQKVAVARERLAHGFTDAECTSFFRRDPASCPQTVDALFALFDDDLAASQP